MSETDTNEAVLRARIFVACRLDREQAEQAVDWALYDATCEADQAVRTLCLERTPSHLVAERVLKAAQEIYAFAQEGGQNDPDSPA